MKILMLICLIITVAPMSRSWSSPACDIEISVSALNSNAQHLESDTSVSKVFAGRDKKDPFLTFAKNTETALLKTVTKDLCTDESSSNPVSIDLTFLRLRLMSSKPEIDRLRSKLSEMKGAYANVTVDRVHRTVKATVLWNPRRMLRDQLIVEGWKFDEKPPLLPFTRPEVYELRHRIFEPYFEDKRKMRPAIVLRLRRGDMQPAKQQIGGTYPDDMFGLMVAMQKNRPFSPSGDPFALATKTLVSSSRLGYLAMTEAAMYRAFKGEALPPLYSIQDITEPNLRNLYKKSGWSSGIKPLK